MPLYSYRCPAGHEFTELRTVEKRASSECPECRKPAMQRITTVAFDPRMGLDPAFSTMSDKWAKSRERRSRKG